MPGVSWATKAQQDFIEEKFPSYHEAVKKGRSAVRDWWKPVMVTWVQRFPMMNELVETQKLGQHVLEAGYKLDPTESKTFKAANKARAQQIKTLFRYRHNKLYGSVGAGVRGGNKNGVTHAAKAFATKQRRVHTRAEVFYNLNQEKLDMLIADAIEVRKLELQAKKPKDEDGDDEDGDDDESDDDDDDDDEKQSTLATGSKVDAKDRGWNLRVRAEVIKRELECASADDLQAVEEELRREREELGREADMERSGRGLARDPKLRKEGLDRIEAFMVENGRLIWNQTAMATITIGVTVDPENPNKLKSVVVAFGKNPAGQVFTDAEPDFAKQVVKPFRSWARTNLFSPSICQDAISKHRAYVDQLGTKDEEDWDEGEGGLSVTETGVEDTAEASAKDTSVKGSAEVREWTNSGLKPAATAVSRSHASGFSANASTVSNLSSSTVQEVAAHASGVAVTDRPPAATLSVSGPTPPQSHPSEAHSRTQKAAESSSASAQKASTQLSKVPVPPASNPSVSAQLSQKPRPRPLAKKNKEMSQEPRINIVKASQNDGRLPAQSSGSSLTGEPTSHHLAAPTLISHAPAAANLNKSTMPVVTPNSILPTFVDTGSLANPQPDPTTSLPNPQQPQPANGPSEPIELGLQRAGISPPPITTDFGPVGGQFNDGDEDGDDDNNDDDDEGESGGENGFGDTFDSAELWAKLRTNVPLNPPKKASKPASVSTPEEEDVDVVDPKPTKAKGRRKAATKKRAPAKRKATQTKSSVKNNATRDRGSGEGAASGDLSPEASPSAEAVIDPISNDNDMDNETQPSSLKRKASMTTIAPEEGRSKRSRNKTKLPDGTTFVAPARTARAAKPKVDKEMDGSKKVGKK